MDTGGVIHFKDRVLTEENKREFTEVTLKKFLDCRKEWTGVVVTWHLIESTKCLFVCFVARESLDKSFSWCCWHPSDSESTIPCIMLSTLYKCFETRKSQKLYTKKWKCSWTTTVSNHPLLQHCYWVLINVNLHTYHYQTKQLCYN